MTAHFRAPLVALLSLSAGLLNGQTGCQQELFPILCTNPVPVTNITGSWDDSITGKWSLTSTSTSVVGSMQAPNPNSSSCPHVVWTVSGTISPTPQTDYVQGTTYFSWTAANPVPSGTCGGWTPYPTITFSGTIQNNGNDIGIGQYANGQSSGSLNLYKNPRDIPVSETTNAVGFSSGLFATVGQFRQSLNASSGSQNIFQGRQVFESTGPSSQYNNYDNCWFTGSTVPKMASVQGSGWNVGYYIYNPPYIINDNEWVDDYIGWNTAQVYYYRQMLRPSSFPCAFQVPQVMSIIVSGQVGWGQAYSSLGSVGEQIYLNPRQVTATRNGVSQTTNQ